MDTRPFKSKWIDTNPYPRWADRGNQIQFNLGLRRDYAVSMQSRSGYPFCNVGNPHCSGLVYTSVMYICIYVYTHSVRLDSHILSIACRASTLLIAPLGPRWVDAGNYRNIEIHIHTNANLSKSVQVRSNQHKTYNISRTAEHYMYMCIYTYVSYTYIYTWIYTYIHVYTYIYKYIYVRV